MRFSLTEDEQMIVDGVAELCERSIRAQASAWDEAGALPDGVRGELGELGLFGLGTSEAHGGVELSGVAATAVLERLGEGDAAVALLVAQHDRLAAAHVRRAGTEAQQGTWLPQWAAGEALATWADPTASEVTEAGGALSGSAGVVVGAQLAQHVVVHAKTEDGVLSVVLDVSAPGVTVEPVARIGTRADGAARVRLEGVAIADDARLGSAGDGVAQALVAEQHVALAAIACGVGRAATAAATAYAKEREQFGQPIAHFQAIQWKLADAGTELDAAGLLARSAAWSLMQRNEDGPGAAARAKRAATAAAEKACSEALQIHGGYGYTREFPVERHLRAAKTLSIAAGTSRAARAVAAQAILRRFGG